MTLPFNLRLKEFARDLRRNMTAAESYIWGRIRRKQLKGFQFYRQKNIGHYIVDFYCPAAKLVVELDGGQHYSEDSSRADAERDTFLAACGLTVLRFTNREVFEEADAVVQRIYDQL